MRRFRGALVLGMVAALSGGIASGGLASADDGADGLDADFDALASLSEQADPRSSPEGSEYSVELGFSEGSGGLLIAGGEGMLRLRGGWEAGLSIAGTRSDAGGAVFSRAGFGRSRGDGAFDWSLGTSLQLLPGNTSAPGADVSMAFELGRLWDSRRSTRLELSAESVLFQQTVFRQRRPRIPITRRFVQAIMGGAIRQEFGAAFGLTLGGELGFYPDQVEEALAAIAAGSSDGNPVPVLLSLPRSSWNISLQWFPSEAVSFDLGYSATELAVAGARFDGASLAGDLPLAPGLNLQLGGSVTWLGGESPATYWQLDQALVLVW
jgi:hypothetical protein